MDTLISQLDQKYALYKKNISEHFIDSDTLVFESAYDYFCITEKQPKIKEILEKDRQDLGGTCDVVMTAETPEEMMKKGGDHVNEMATAGDEAHIALKAEMDGAMTDKEAMDAWQKQFAENWEKAPLV